MRITKTIGPSIGPSGGGGGKPPPDGFGGVGPAKTSKQEPIKNKKNIL